MFDFAQIVWQASMGRAKLSLANMQLGKFASKEEKAVTWCDADNRHHSERWLKKNQYQIPTLEELMR